MSAGRIGGLPSRTNLGRAPLRSTARPGPSRWGSFRERMMPETVDLHPAAPWQEVRTTPADWRAADERLLLRILHHLALIRAFEETVLELAVAGLVHGPAHSSIGQEGGAVGAM